MPPLNERVAKAESILDDLKKQYLDNKEKTDIRIGIVENDVSDLKTGHQQSSDGIAQILKKIEERRNDWRFWVAIFSGPALTIFFKVVEYFDKVVKP
jgi:hypothetical protein